MLRVRSLDYGPLFETRRPLGGARDHALVPLVDLKGGTARTQFVRVHGLSTTSIAAETRLASFGRSPLNRCPDAEVRFVVVTGTSAQATVAGPAQPLTQSIVLPEKKHGDLANGRPAVPRAANSLAMPEATLFSLRPTADLTTSNRVARSCRIRVCDTEDATTPVLPKNFVFAPLDARWEAKMFTERMRALDTNPTIGEWPEVASIAAAWVQCVVRTRSTAVQALMPGEAFSEWLAEVSRRIGSDADFVPAQILGMVVGISAAKTYFAREITADIVTDFYFAGLRHAAWLGYEGLAALYDLEGVSPSSPGAGRDTVDAAVQSLFERTTPVDESKDVHVHLQPLMEQIRMR